MNSLEWALIHYYWCPYKKRLGHRYTEERHREKVATEEASEEINPATTLNSEFQPPEL